MGTYTLFIVCTVCKARCRVILLSVHLNSGKTDPWSLHDLQGLGHVAGWETYGLQYMT